MTLCEFHKNQKKYRIYKYTNVNCEVTDREREIPFVVNVALQSIGVSN